MKKSAFKFGVYTALFCSYGFMLLIIELFGMTIPFFEWEFYKIMQLLFACGGVGIVYEAWKFRSYADKEDVNP